MAMRYNGLEVALPAFSVLLLLALTYDLFMGRPIHIGPVQGLFVFLFSVAYAASLLMLYYTIKGILAVEREEIASIDRLQEDLGVRGGRPTTEAIITSFAVRCTSKGDYSMYTKDGLRNLEALKRYIRSRTGEDISIVDISNAVGNIRKTLRERELAVAEEKELFGGETCRRCGSPAVINHECQVCGAWYPVP